MDSKYNRQHKLENQLEATKLALVNIPIHNTKQNMTRAEQIALKTLSKNNNITIKPFDKGSGTAALNTTDYIIECERQLGDPSYYTKLTKDDTEDIVLCHTQSYNRNVQQKLHRLRHIQISRSSKQ